MQKAEIIYAQVRGELSTRLWRAALGAEDDDARPIGEGRKSPIGLSALLSLMEDSKDLPLQPRSLAEEPPSVPERQEPSRDSSPPWNGERQAETASRPNSQGYGPNAGYAVMLNSAAQRTGLPAASLAAIVHAEAAKGADGRWLPYSRNPRSSAAGLGQFLSGTWRGEAEREGTWLNMVARRQGWISDHGRVKGEHRAALLALRYDPEAAIQATADYAKANLDALRHAGVAMGEGTEAIAQAAYLGHHLGRGDAIRFLKGGLDPDRARLLLNAQIGTASANRRIAASGSAVTAHRAWLLDYVGRNIRPQRFDV